MMHKKIFHLYAWIIVSLSFAALFLTLFSWLFSLYGMDVQNLLSVEGLRWLFRYSLRQVQNNFPFLSVIMLGMTFGVFYHSGLLQVFQLLFKRKMNMLSYKQHWGLQVSMLIGFIYLMLIVWGVFSPNGSLLSITGGLNHSPLIEGFAIWFSVGCSIVSALYGRLSGKFKNIYEIVSCVLQGVQFAVPFIVIIFILMHFALMCNYVFKVFP